MPGLTDQTGHRVELASVPKRIVSLVPSQTELLFDLGLEEEVAGITKFCVHPQPWFRSKFRVGGTKTLDFNKVRSVSPDLILCNKEENTKEMVEALREEYTVYTSDIRDLEGAMQMIEQIGLLCGKAQKAAEINEKIKSGFDKIVTSPSAERAVYLIWNDPIMLAGKDTFIHNMLQRAGYENVAAGLEGRYPEVTEDILKKMDPEVVLLSSEPFPFGEKHVARYRELLPDATVKQVDGEMFSWYGSRLLMAPAYFQSLKNG